jgi:hypothetical protein
MKKKTICLMLVISLLISYIPIFPIETVSEAASITTVWEYNFTGSEQEFIVPYKGKYKIEVYGAQGGTANSSVTGGYGSYAIGTATIGKNTSLSIFVGGQNGYNGGGSGNSLYGNGGGATDVRINGNSTNERIIVAAGGGGSYAKANYHSHSSSCYHSHDSSCYYTEPSSVSGYSACPQDHCEGICDVCGNHLAGGGAHTHGGSSYLTCTKSTSTTICGKSTSTIDSYSYANGNSESSSNGTQYQGSTAGGGGYYGGNTQYAGTSYTNTTYLANTSTSEGTREGNGYVKITLIATYPEVELSANTTQYTNNDVLITAVASDKVIGLTSKPYSWNSASNVATNTYLASKNGTYNVSVINNYGNTETASIDINVIDKIAPVVNSVTQRLSSDKTSSVVTINATDSETDEYSASGIVGYALTKTTSQPTTFQSSNQFTITENGTYYAWAKDAVGNISTLSSTGTGGSVSGGTGTVSGSAVLIKDISINVAGTITWNDSDNKYASRSTSTIHLYRKIGENGKETEVANVVIVAGQTSYTFQTRECDDSGNKYIFRIVQDYVEGYETLYTGNSVSSNQTQNVTINIDNNLILPEYTSNIEYNLIDAFRGEYLKNTKVEMIATITASSSNRDKTGLNQSTVTYLIDDGFKIDKNNIEVIYTDAETGQKKVINDYILQKNNLIINYGVGKNYVTKAGDILTIKIQGVFNEIKDYENSITLTGNLTDYTGNNTSISLGEVTKKEKNFTVQYQKPQARISIRNTDSITEESLTDATFTLYEWDGTQYVEKEILTDTDGDGIYTSSYYEWTSTTEGKYRVVETGTPLNHKDLSFSMEYTINQLKTDNYTITPDYSNGEYRIAYEKRTPDDFDRVDGVVENEPFKIKVSINNTDVQTKQVIQSNAVYKIYEWNNTLNQYEEYVSKVTGNNVEMVRGTDKIYLSSEWLYYTNNNEGKYKIIEVTSANGYYGDYLSTGEKNEYYINILDVINNGTYEGQTVENEATLQLRNNTEANTIENKRVNTLVNIELIDKETASNTVQASATLQGAVYGIYASEQVLHADGITSNYENENGVLYKKDELVGTFTTDEEGQILVDSLECGKYYIKQQTASEGYVKDETIYEIDLTYQGQEKVLIQIDQICENTVKKQAFQILKQQNIGNNETSPLANAGFTIYEIKELSIVKTGKITKNTDGTYTLNDEQAKKDSNITKKANSNGTYNIQDLVDYYYKIAYTEENMQLLPQGENVYYPYNLSGETLVTNYENVSSGEQINELVTQSTGYIKSPELAYGEYIVIETSVPNDFVAVTPIVIKIISDDRTAQNLRYIVDPNFETKLKIYTKDSETGETILKGNAKFVIKNTDTGELVTYKSLSQQGEIIEYGTYENPYETTRKGYLITPVTLDVGNYELVQLNAPNGYVLNGYEGYSQDGEIIETPSVCAKLTISTNQLYFVDNELESNIIVAVQENKQQVGTIQVTVSGEKLANVDKTTPEIFNYSVNTLEGVKIALYAKTDIYTQDEQKTKVYLQDELIASAITNSNGIAHFDNIPIGNYYIKEVSTINGFSLNKETTDITVTYGTNIATLQEQQTPVVKYEVQENSIRQKVSITITDKDIQTNEAIAGTVIGIYANEDILNEQGEIILKKDELIEQQTTDEQGIIQIICDLPLGNYYAKEIQSGAGYIENLEIIEINANYEEDGRAVVIIEKEMQSKKTAIYIQAVDEDGDGIKNSELQITDEEGNVLVEWINTEELQEIQKLEVEKNYILKQKQPLDGYVSFEKIMFKLQTDGSLTQQTSDEYNTLKVIHYTTKLQIQLADEVNKEQIYGAELSIKDEEENEVATVSIDENESSDEGETNLTTDEIIESIIEKLPVGTYTVESTKMPYGYKELNTIITIEDKQGLQTIVIEAQREEFDLQVEEWLLKIDRNQKTEYENTDLEDKMKKVDIKDKNISTEDIRITYKIKVSNVGKITGEVGKVEVTIPNGMKFDASDNKLYWSLEDGKVVTYGLAGREITEGSYAEIELVLRWKNGIENFGTKQVEVKILETKSDIGFKETNDDNNTAKTEVIIGVSTGEMNLVYICWVLLAILVVIEIVVSRKTKIKKFSIKDRTLKYRKKN